MKKVLFFWVGFVYGGPYKVINKERIYDKHVIATQIVNYANQNEDYVDCLKSVRGNKWKPSLELKRSKDCNVVKCNIEEYLIQSNDMFLAWCNIFGDCKQETVNGFEHLQRICSLIFNINSDWSLINRDGTGIKKSGEVYKIAHELKFARFLYEYCDEILLEKLFPNGNLTIIKCSCRDGNDRLYVPKRVVENNHKLQKYVLFGFSLVLILLYNKPTRG